MKTTPRPLERWVNLGVLIAFVAAAPAYAFAATATLELDGLSGFSFAGSRSGAVFPRGTVIPLELTRASDTSWSVSIPVDQFVLPALEYANGAKVTWKLMTAATGRLVVVDGGISLNIVVLAVPHSDDQRGRGAFRLNFTTGHSERSAGGHTSRSDGALLDEATGYVRLVATGVNPKGSENSPGEPFTVVLSGIVSGLPPGLSN